MMVLAAAGAGCAYTTTTALLPSHIKKVAVPVFENATSEYNLEREITDAVIARFVSDNHVKIVDERSADRSEERRVGKECRSGWWAYEVKKEKEKQRKKGE